VPIAQAGFRGIRAKGWIAARDSNVRSPRFDELC
jgi:hypothetical protein